MSPYNCVDLVCARNDYIRSVRKDNRWDIPAEDCDLPSLAQKWDIPSSTLAVVSDCEKWRELRREYGKCFAKCEAPRAEAGDQVPEEKTLEAQWLPELDPEERRRRFIEILEVRIEEEPKECENALADCRACRACA